MIPFSGEVDFKGNSKPGKCETVQKITGNVNNHLKTKKY